jgi:hypothetical protein
MAFLAQGGKRIALGRQSLIGAVVGCLRFGDRLADPFDLLGRSLRLRTCCLPGLLGLDPASVEQVPLNQPDLVGDLAVALRCASLPAELSRALLLVGQYLAVAR